MSETEWPQVGDRVAIYQNYFNGAHVRFAHVERLTKTRVVLDDGERFSRASLSRNTGSWGDTRDLLRPDDERVTRARVENHRKGLRSRVADAYDAWWRARSTDDGTLLRALGTSVEAALADMGESK